MHSIRLDVAADQTALQFGYRTGIEPKWTYGASFLPGLFSDPDKPRYIMDSKRWVYRFPGVRIKPEYKPYTEERRGWTIAFAPAILLPVIICVLAYLSGFRIQRGRDKSELGETA